MSVTTEAPQALLEVSDFSVTLHTPKTSVRPVDHVSYRLYPREVLAIVGESGSGKTILNMAPLDLLPAGVNADMTGAVYFGGRNILGARADELQRIHGGEIGVIFQDPLSALNPVRRIGRQVAEIAERHLGMTVAQAERRAADLLSMVGLPDPLSRLQQYPHELSGGMRQRVGVAMSIAGEPKLLIADEPTTALDVTVQAQIVSLLKDLQQRLGMAIVVITHDFGVVSGLATKVAVMYAGRLSELGQVDEVLVEPAHPYTKELLRSVPSLSSAIGSKFVGLSGAAGPVTPHHGLCFRSSLLCGPSELPHRGAAIAVRAAFRDRHVAACPITVNDIA